MLNEELLKNVMATIFRIDPNEIAADSSMDTISSWDSLRHMSLILALEEEFKVVIPDEDVANITSYKLIRLVLEELLSAAGN